MNLVKSERTLIRPEDVHREVEADGIVAQVVNESCFLRRTDGPHGTRLRWDVQHVDVLLMEDRQKPKDVLRQQKRCHQVSPNHHHQSSLNKIKYCQVLPSVK